jgi:large subunit ribosomal protein L13
MLTGSASASLALRRSYIDRCRPRLTRSADTSSEGGKGFLMGSFVPTAGSVERQWHVIDADGQVLGRIATEAARLLQGKHKAVYTPHIDTGDHVVIVNAARIRLTGRKEEQKLYRYHSGYEGGLREERAKDLRQRNPVRMVEEAVRGMLPKTKLGEAMWRKLKVYAEASHPHQAQKPRPLGKHSKSEAKKDKSMSKREVA